ncbi:MAG: hypothetical protein NTU91_05020 [Chloroflexi bacterium]|nr:hypothetical protein [Chloroflexota bacterium]
MKKESLRWTAAALIAVPALGLAVLLLDPTGFPFWRGGAYSDLLISHWPIAAFIRESIATWHQVPLWNPLILSGMPLTADPLAGFWYAPNVLGWLSSSGLGFNLLFWAHLGLAACGVMRLLRSEGATPVAAFLGGIAFAATPKLIGHIGLGHLTLVEAVCWTPWVLLAVRRAIDGALEPAGRLWRFGLAGALLGLTSLIDPRWVIPAGLLGVAYAGKCLAHSQPRPGRIGVGRSLVACLIGLGVAAPALIPLLELATRTTRWGMTAGVAEEMSLAPARLVGAALFDGGGWPEAQTYLGATVVLLLAVGAAASVRRGRFWTATLVVSLFLALGSFTPLYGWVMRVVPGMSSLRVPARFYMIVALAAAMLAGHAFDHLRNAASDALAARRVRLVAVGAGALALALPVLVLFVRITQSGASGLAQSWVGLAGGILACAAAACVLIIVKGGQARRVAGIALLGLVALDLGWANVFTLRVEPAEAALSTSACELAGEAADYGTSRIFSPSYSVPQQAAQLCSLELADGVNPLQLTAYRDAMASATGFSTASYGVTLPPFPDGDVRLDWHPAIDASALGLLNVERIVSAYPLDAPGLELLTQRDGQWIYRNLRARPRAWLEPEEADAGEWRSVVAFEWTPNVIRIRVDGPGRLVLSEIAYPGWRASVDGTSALVETHAGILRSVELAAGEHEVVLKFVPGTLVWGCALCVLALLALLVLKVRR